MCCDGTAGKHLIPNDGQKEADIACYALIPLCMRPQCSAILNMAAIEERQMGMELPSLMHISFS